LPGTNNSFKTFGPENFESGVLRKNLLKTVSIGENILDTYAGKQLKTAVLSCHPQMSKNTGVENNN
jgi:hypothetical protein